MELKIWNLSTGQCIRTLKKKEKVVCCTSLSSNNYLASGYGTTIKIWNLDDGNTLLKLDNKSNVYCLLLLLNGRLASGSQDTFIRFFRFLILIRDELLVAKCHNYKDSNSLSLKFYLYQIYLYVKSS